MIYFDGSYLKCPKVDIPLNKIGSRSGNRDFREPLKTRLKIFHFPLIFSIIKL